MPRNLNLLRSPISCESLSKGSGLSFESEAMELLRV